MTYTIDLGWWLAPLAVTVLAFGWASFMHRPSPNPSYGDGVVGVFFFGAALIVSLVAWLVWAAL